MIHALLSTVVMQARALAFPGALRQRVVEGGVGKEALRSRAPFLDSLHIGTDLPILHDGQAR
jgi:hypothetical protein